MQPTDLRLLDTFRHQRRVLLGFTRELLALHDAPAIARRIAEAAVALVPAERGRVVAVARGAGPGRTLASIGWPGENSPDAEVDHVVHSGAALVVEDYTRESRIVIPADYATLGIRSGAAMPMRDGDELIGVMLIHRGEPGDWMPLELEGLEFLAHLGATALRYARQCDRVEKSAEQQARTQRELRLKSAALHATEDMVVITDVHGTVEYVNPAFEEFTGYRSEDVLGQRFAFLKSAESAPYVYHDIWETLTTGRSWKGVVLNDRRDGTDYLEEQTITPVPNEAGEVDHIVAIKRPLPPDRTA